MVAPSSTDVDLYMACVGNKRQPEPPVREALMSLGVETIIPEASEKSKTLSNSFVGNSSTKDNVKSPTSVFDVIEQNNGKRLKTQQNKRKDAYGESSDLLSDALEFNERLGCSFGKCKSQMSNGEDGRNELNTERKRKSRGSKTMSADTRDVENRSINTYGSTHSPDFLGYTQDDAAALIEECSVSIVELFSDMSTLFGTTLKDMQGNDEVDAKGEQSTKQQMIRRLLCQNPEDLDERSGRLYLILKCSDAAEDHEEISIILDRYPHLARAADRNKRLPLHVVASRTLQIPTEASIEYTQPRAHRVILADAMNQHVLRLKGVLNTVYGSNTLAAASVDSTGALPLHYLAKQFWQLELIWTEEMKKPISETARYPRRPYISNYPLFDEGTKMVLKLLKPIIDSQTRGLLRTAGPTGCLLPLHIAAIYGVPYQTVQLMLTRYPDSAHIPCKKALLGINEALALELYESRRVDSKSNKKGKGKKSSEAESDSKDSLLGTSFDRTSDLIFAYNPNILPYRKNQERLKRIEHRIVQDAMRKDAEFLTKPTKLLWIWLCTFKNEEDEHDHYEDNVEVILNELDVLATEKLLSVKGPNDESLIDIATPHCIPLLRKAQTEAMRREIDENLNIAGNNDFVSIGTLCREVFGIKEEDIPTNFVILPYKVQLKDDNTVSLASRDDVDIAMDFAKALAEVNNIEGVARAIAGMPAPAPNQDEYDALSSTSSLGTWSEFHSLLDTYETGLGYLYLLDETSGTPMIPDRRKSNKIETYPIALEMSSTDVLHLLPLMQMGATLMRGKLGVSILAQMILGQAKPDSPPSFFETVKDALVLLRNYEGEEYVELGSQLKDLIIAHQLKAAATLESEKMESSPVNKWLMPIRILRETISLNDPKHTFAGLSKRQSSEKSSFIWTTVSESDHIAEFPSISPIGMSNETDKPTDKSKAFSSSTGQKTEDDVWSLADGVSLHEKSGPPSSDFAKGAAAVATVKATKQVREAKTNTSSVANSHESSTIGQDEGTSKENDISLDPPIFDKHSNPSRRDIDLPTDPQLSKGDSKTSELKSNMTTIQQASKGETGSWIGLSSATVQSRQSQSQGRANQTAAKRATKNERYEELDTSSARNATRIEPSSSGQKSPSATEKVLQAQSIGKYDTSQRNVAPQISRHSEGKKEGTTIGPYGHKIKAKKRKSRQASQVSLRLQELLKEKNHSLPLNRNKKKSSIRSLGSGLSNLEALKQSIQQAEREEDELRQEVEALQETISSVVFRRRRQTRTRHNRSGRRSPVIRLNRRSSSRKKSRSERLKFIAKKIYELESEEQMLLVEKAALEERASSRLKVRAEQKIKEADEDAVVDSEKHERRAQRDARYSKLTARIEAVESEMDVTVSNKKSMRRSDQEARFFMLKARIDTLEKQLRDQQLLITARNE